MNRTALSRVGVGIFVEELLELDALGFESAGENEVFAAYNGDALTLEEEFGDLGGEAAHDVALAVDKQLLFEH